MTLPTLDIIVIGLNEGEHLTRCLESVREALKNAAGQVQAGQLIYVDSGSSDASLSIAAGYCDRIFLLQESPSAGKARHVGIDNSDADYVLLLDGDMELEATWLRHALPLLSESDGNVAGIIGQRDDVFPVDSMQAPSLHKNVYRVTSTRRAPHIGGALLAKRDAILAAGNYRLSLPTAEEPDLYARILRNGQYVLEVPYPFIRHHTHRAPLRSRLIRQLKPRGLAFDFGCSFWASVKEGYLPYLIKVHPATFIVWAMDCLALLGMAFFGLKALFVGQLAIITVLWVRRKPKDFISSRIRFWGVVTAGLSALRNRTTAPDLHTVSYRELDRK